MNLIDESKILTVNFTFKENYKYEITLRKEPSSDLNVFHQMFQGEEYKPLVELIFNDNKIKGPLSILDAGGNVGLASIYFNCYFPGSHFIIVEPEQENFNILERNIQRNNLLNNTKLIKGGVWYREAYLNTARNFRDGNDWSVTVEESEKPTDLKGFSILSLMDKFNFNLLDILKIDIEGAERYLFEDPLKASSFLAKTKYIAMEIHDEFKCRSDIYSCLKKNNFDFFDADELTIGKNMALLS
jgi:FkbM family methyltransferase